MATIGTNIGALNSSYYLTLNNEALGKSVKRLSSGSRLADPVDDAAGVAVSGNLDARVKRLMAAAESAQNVISFAQTADGFLKTIQEALGRMSELAQRATNGAFGSADRANYATEFNVLKSQIDSIAVNAKFNGTTLFTSTTITVAINADGTTDSFATTSLGSTTTLGINGTTIGDVTAAVTAITSLNTAIQSITTRRAAVNADISKFQFHVQNIRTEKINVEAANARIKDLNVAEESTALAKNNILLQASSAMLAQANQSQQALLSLLR
jgi:flagellin